MSPTTPVPNTIYDGYDDALRLWYVDLVGTSLVWSTDRTDIQDPVLGTGTNPTLHLYSNDCFGVTHTIRREAVDSDGNPSSPQTFQVFIDTIR